MIGDADPDWYICSSLSNQSKLFQVYIGNVYDYLVSSAEFPPLEGSSFVRNKKSSSSTFIHRSRHEDENQAE